MCRSGGGDGGPPVAGEDKADESGTSDWSDTGSREEASHGVDAEEAALVASAYASLAACPMQRDPAG